MTDYNTMTAQQCADWLAERDGWTWRAYAGDKHWRLWTLAAKNAEQFDHPYPLTLDAAAGALKAPWRLVRVELNHDGKALATIYNGAECKWEHFDGTNELTARYRAAVAARMEDDK